MMIDWHLIHDANPYEGFPWQNWSLDLQGWNGMSPIFRRLIEQLEPSLVIEVGTWKGQSAVTMGLELKKRGGKLICVDTWLGSKEFWTDRNRTEHFASLNLKHGYPTVYYQFLSNMCRMELDDTVIPFPVHSTTAASYLLDAKVRSKLIYIDASHEPGEVYADLAAWWSLVEPGGVMFGDDYNGWPEVRADVDLFAKRHEEELAFSVDEAFWVMEKRRESLRVTSSVPIRPICED